MLITNALLAAMGTKEEHFPKTNLKEIILSGRSNVGKSSFINSMVGRTNLAYTSSKPGKTQTLNFFLINDQFYFVDVPGYGYAKVSKEQREKFGIMIESYLKTRTELVLAVLLVDFRHEPTQDDILMYNFLKYYGIKTLVVATKSDKVGITSHQKQIKLIKQALKFSDTDHFVKYSSVTLEGYEQTWNYILDALREE